MIQYKIEFILNELHNSSDTEESIGWWVKGRITHPKDTTGFSIDNLKVKRITPKERKRK